MKPSPLQDLTINQIMSELTNNNTPDTTKPLRTKQLQEEARRRGIETTFKEQPPCRTNTAGHTASSTHPENQQS